MAERLGTMYHWSPHDRRRDVRREGLLPYSRPVVHTGDLSYPYVCLAPTPSAAWGLSGETLEDDFGGWDLWQVQLPKTVTVRVLPDWGDMIREVRVMGAIPVDHVWYVGTRQPPSAEEARP